MKKDQSAQPIEKAEPQSVESSKDSSLNNGNLIDFNFVRIFGKLFVPIVGLVYATGFLIVFTFLNRYYGLQDTGSLVKAKYLYVGAMYYICLLVIIVPIYAIFYHNAFVRKLKNLQKGRKLNKDHLEFIKNYNVGIYLPAVSTLLVWLVTFYIIAFFAPGSMVQDHYWLLLGHFIPIFAMSVIIEIGRFLRSKFKLRLENYENKAFWCFFGLMLALFIIDIFALSEVFNKIFKIMENGGIFFIFLISCLGIYFYRIIRYNDNIPFEKLRVCNWAVQCSFMFTIYFFSILSFSVFIFSHIPSNKGGGDYNYSPNIAITFKKDVNPYPLIDCNSNISCSKPLKMVEETANSIFVIEKKDLDGKIPKPRIYEIKRDNIALIIYE